MAILYFDDSTAVNGNNQNLQKCAFASM